MTNNSSAAHLQLEAGQDALSEVLQDFRLSGVNYGRLELRHPWSLAFPEQPQLRFHFVSRGPCWVHTKTKGWEELSDGDLVLLPQGAEHRLASTPDKTDDSMSKCQITKLGGNVCKVVKDGDGSASILFSGSMELGAYALHPLISLMPTIIRGNDVATHDPMVNPLIAAMTVEACEPRMGSATILSRMADLLTARLIRCWVKGHEDDTTGWLAAIRDPHVGRALVAMHREPGRNWTIESLAALAGQSRSVFAERFSAILGEGAARYLARLRMQLAQEWLAQNSMATAEVASRLGYESEASFARAFKRITNASPGAVRRSASGRIDMELGF
ncbi:AraC family transcriptional regulator [Devosia epidermidihirudinis]|uniref:AraC family transcriptional regulator n=1 Tax=Devosia epidermidihirudinis TaxID=1293439 RepID=A0A0F5QFW4_9HYPH|nr:AraC family transcriptional regulator [Devosia epidermidihirudinis]KKC39845.1 AraC family transcriptional regulator [Devosia epidermidihirudinis]